MFSMLRSAWNGVLSAVAVAGFLAQHQIGKVPCRIFKFNTGSGSHIQCIDALKGGDSGEILQGIDDFIGKDIENLRVRRQQVAADGIPDPGKGLPGLYLRKSVPDVAVLCTGAEKKGCAAFF